LDIKHYPSISFRFQRSHGLTRRRTPQHRPYFSPRTTASHTDDTTITTSLNQFHRRQIIRKRTESDSIYCRRRVAAAAVNRSIRYNSKNIFWFREELVSRRKERKGWRNREESERCVQESVALGLARVNFCFSEYLLHFTSCYFLCFAYGAHS
jgi:hypothetical protein